MKIKVFIVRIRVGIMVIDLIVSSCKYFLRHSRMARNWGSEHTPIFHTVNQIMNHSIEMLNLLLEKSSDLKYTVAGLIWGKGYEWQTLIPSVNPISYAMMGLLPQMHRDEIEISKIVSLMLKVDYGINYTPSNVPNSYLKHKGIKTG